jgi:hypothetical protein
MTARMLCGYLNASIRPFELPHDAVLPTLSQRGGGIPTQRCHSVPVKPFSRRPLLDHRKHTGQPLFARLRTFTSIEYNQGFLEMAHEPISWTYVTRRFHCPLLAAKPSDLVKAKTEPKVCQAIVSNYCQWSLTGRSRAITQIDAIHVQMTLSFPGFCLAFAFVPSGHCTSIHGATGFSQVGVPFDSIRAIGLLASTTFRVYIRQRPLLAVQLLPGSCTWLPLHVLHPSLRSIFCCNFSAFHSFSEAFVSLHPDAPEYSRNLFLTKPLFSGRVVFNSVILLC